MQDRYVGDIGDYAKYGLLRGVLGESSLRLGVMWYAVPDEDHNNDGRHIHYLKDVNFRKCDPVLYDALGGIVARGERRLTAVHDARVLPPSTIFYDAALSFAGIPSMQRPDHRRAWLQDGYDALTKADVIFADPDNGLETAIDRHADKGPKFTFYDDLVPIARKGKSLIIYQHASRQGSFTDQLQKRISHLRTHLSPHISTFAVVRFRRASARAFISAMADRHAATLQDRIGTFLTSAWGEHFDGI